MVVLTLPTGAWAQNVTLHDYDFSEASATQWRLPGRLREISGLTLGREGRLFAHNDERAVIFEINPTARRVVKGFAMGDPVRGDFEGIAYAEERFYLVTSGGLIYESREGEADERMLYNIYGTGVGKKCEVEGLAFEPADRVLLLVCKTPRDKEIEDFVAIYRFSLDSREITGAPLLIPLGEITSRIDGKSFRPSGIERHPLSGNYIIVAAQQSAMAEITPDGRVVAVVKLKRGNHRQIEGITFTSDGTLLLADEGGRRRARLTLYHLR